MQQIRKIDKTEIVILEYLVKQAGMQLPDEWKHNLFVRQLDDGGMGSFLIFQNTTDYVEERKFGKQVSEFEFVDEDGVLVFVSLNVDQNDEPFEVDVWKTDFNPVIKLKVPD